MNVVWINVVARLHTIIPDIMKWHDTSLVACGNQFFWFMSVLSSSYFGDLQTNENYLLYSIVFFKVFVIIKSSVLRHI